MKVNTIINRYIMGEMIPPFVINLAFFTFVFLMTKILEITNLVVNYQVDLVVVLLLLIYNMPFFMIYIFPMATMMSILLTFLRLSSDNEITALRAGGMSIYGLLPPVLLFSLVGCLLAACMSIYGLPWGRTSFKRLVYEVASSSFEAGIKERTFFDQIPGVVIYIHKIDKKRNRLVDIFVEDRRTEDLVSTVIAPSGRLSMNPETLSFHFELNNGSIHQVNLTRRSSNTVKFFTYHINLSLNKVVAAGRSGPKDEEEMSLSELRHYLATAEKDQKQYHIALTEYHRKFSVPVACFALGLIAFPFGVQLKSAKRSFGLGLGLFFFLVYYLMLSAGWVLGEAGVYPPLIGMWVPNVVIGGLGLIFLVRTAREKEINFTPLFQWVGGLFTRYRRDA